MYSTLKALTFTVAIKLISIPLVSSVIIMKMDGSNFTHIYAKTLNTISLNLLMYNSMSQK